MLCSPAAGSMRGAAQAPAILVERIWRACAAFLFTAHLARRLVEPGRAPMEPWKCTGIPCGILRWGQDMGWAPGSDSPHRGDPNSNEDLAQTLVCGSAGSARRGQAGDALVVLLIPDLAREILGTRYWWAQILQSLLRQHDSPSFQARFSRRLQSPQPHGRDRNMFTLRLSGPVQYNSLRDGTNRGGAFVCSALYVPQSGYEG